LQKRKGRKATGEYMVLNRDFTKNHNELVLECHTKQSRLAKRRQKERFAFPKPDCGYSKLNFVGPFWAYNIISCILSRSKREMYFTRPLWKGAKRAPMDVQYIGEWMRRVKKRCKPLADTLSSAPQGYRWNPSTLRSQIITIMQKVAENPRELMLLTGHKNPTTAIRYYVGVNKKRERELKKSVFKRFTGNPI
jgi:hypothetical protein